MKTEAFDDGFKNGAFENASFLVDRRKRNLLKTVRKKGQVLSFPSAFSRVLVDYRRKCLKNYGNGLVRTGENKPKMLLWANTTFCFVSFRRKRILLKSIRVVDA